MIRDCSLAALDPETAAFLRRQLDALLETAEASPRRDAAFSREVARAWAKLDSSDPPGSLSPREAQALEVLTYFTQGMARYMIRQLQELRRRLHAIRPATARPAGQGNHERRKAC